MTDTHTFAKAFPKHQAEPFGGTLVQPVLVGDSDSGDVAIASASGFFFQPRVPCFQCAVRLTQEPDGFSAYVAQLPGVVTHGETQAEALANAREAVAAAIDSYRDAGDAIPWRLNAEPRAAQEIEKWILVDG